MSHASLSLPSDTQRSYRIAVCAFYFIQGLVFATWACRIPQIKANLGLSEGDLGTVLFAIPIGQLSVMALSGMLVARFGSRPMVMLGSICYMSVLILLGHVGSFWELFIGLYLFGVSANLTNIAVNTQGVGVERLYRRSIMARFHGVWSLAGFAGSLIGAVMSKWSVPPEVHFLWVAVGCALVWGYFQRFLLPRDAKRSTEAGAGKGMFSGLDAFILLLGILAFGSMVSEGTMFDWSGVYFAKVVQPGESLVWIGYSAFMLTMAIGRFTADSLVTRFGPVAVLRLSGMLIAAGLLLAVAWPTLVPATIGFLLVGFGTSSIVPICYSMAGKSKKISPGPAIAAVSTIGFMGFLMGPPVIGHIAEAFSLRWSFSLIAVIGLAASLVAPRLRK